MSVLINGMEMPTGCLYCDFRNHDLCELWHRVWDIAINRHKDCPLVPVPDHGDLIDRSVLYAKTVEWEEQARHLSNTAPDARTFDKWATILTERSAFKYDVADASTIIPADGGAK